MIINANINLSTM